MPHSFPQDYTHQLQSLMQQVGISSLKELIQKSGVSELQLIRLRLGLVMRMQIDTLLKLSQALRVPVSKLLTTFADVDPNQISDAGVALATLQQEYQRLQAQMVEQQHSLEEEFQRSSLQMLESWLVQWPTAAYRVKQNPELPAIRLLPLVRPVEQLLRQWGVKAIAPVGIQVPYNPQLHQLMEGTAEPGEPVLVRYAGYWQRDKLLYRAKVSPINQGE